MAQYAGLSLREIYAVKCDDLHCKKNSGLLKILPDKAGHFEDLETLDLGTNFVGPKGLLPVLEVVGVCVNLHTFSLKDNQLTNQSVCDVCDFAAQHPSLTSLDFSDNPITLSAGKALLQLANLNPRIRAITLDGTNIRPMVARSIANQCQKNKEQAEAQKAGRSWTNGGSIASSSDDKEGVLDENTVRQLYAAAPHSITPLLLDKNPVDSLLVLCEQHDVKFQDPQFAPNNESIPGSKAAGYGVHSWRRVTDIVRSPVLFEGKMNIENIEMGSMNSSAVIACLAEIFRKSSSDNPLADIFYPNQISPRGIYSVKFFIDGKWRYVIIDDYVPCAKKGLPVFLRPLTGDGVWVMLLEKAIAKLHRSYQALDSEAALSASAPERLLNQASLMADLTGGVGISRELNHAEFDKDKWWETLEDAVAKGCLCTAYCNGNKAEAKIQAGLCAYFTYSVLQVRAVTGYRLLRLGGSWLDEDLAWNGDWSSTSLIWEQNPDVARTLGFKPGQAQESQSFWISYTDFLLYFASVGICRRFPKQNAVVVEGIWHGQTAGGPYFEIDWCYNPRYEVRLEGSGALFAHLALPDVRFRPPPLDTIGMHMLKADYFPIRYEPDNVVAKTPYTIADSVTFEAVLNKGLYWLVPSTYTAGQHSEFIIRFFSDAPLSLVRQPIEPYWKEQRLSSRWEASGEYQHGEDNPQFQLVIPPPKGQTMQSAEYDTAFAARTSITMSVGSDKEYSIIFFVCLANPDGRPAGSIPEDHIVAKSKYLISDHVTLNADLGPGTYDVVCCLQPEGSTSKCDMSFWCSRTDFTVSELPLWSKKVLRSEWTAAGVYQSYDRHPQFELSVPKPTRVIIKMVASMCNDPAIVLLVCDNTHSPGQQLRGLIPEDKILAKSAYVRSDSISMEFKISQPKPSYLIVPCLQPPGSKGRVKLSVSSPTGDFQLTELLS